jgi:hypothetical protein
MKALYKKGIVCTSPLEFMKMQSTLKYLANRFDVYSLALCVPRTSGAYGRRFQDGNRLSRRCHDSQAHCISSTYARKHLRLLSPLFSSQFGMGFPRYILHSPYHRSIRSACNY